MDEKKQIANFLSKQNWRTLLWCLFFFLFGMAQFQCGNQDAKEVVYLNHDTAVHYVGMDACKSCHLDIDNTFIETGMGKSFGVATRQKSAGNYKNHQPVYDSSLNNYYYPFWKGDSLYIKEFQLGKNKDTLYQRTEKVDYIIGSGQHTNSHISNRNGYLYQLPLTWYTQKKRWDLPPGFEKGRNVRISREIGMECMSCHNALPKVPDANSNYFNQIPLGIDCERCHGPGELHVKERLSGTKVDTSKGADYTIVNPKRLSWELQTDLCQRCHLQGNAILKPGKQFNEFRPGQKLSNYFNVFMPQYKGGEKEIIMASHAQRLQESQCFLKSNPKELNNQNASLKLTCINCHNPHVSVKKTGIAQFNNACLKCHEATACNEIKQEPNPIAQNCVACHMPSSGAIDIPHVSVHDHKIAIPHKTQSAKELKSFLGLYCITKGNVTFTDRAAAYLNYAEKFEAAQQLVLDSAHFFINQIEDISSTQALQIHSYFLQGNDAKIVELANSMQVAMQTDAWTAYRVGQAYLNTNQFAAAEMWLEKSSALAFANLKIQVKWASACIMNAHVDKGISILQSLLQKNDNAEDAWTNLGYAYAMKSDFKQALNCYNQELQLNPNHRQALLNRAAVYFNLRNNIEAKNDLLKLKKLDPTNEQISALLKQLN